MKREVPNETNPNSTYETDRIAKIFVWMAFLIVLLFAFFCVAKYGQNIPLHEDWVFVPILTGHAPHFWDWLWSQNGEHRDPVARLILFILLKVTYGDFRVGMVFNVVTLAMVAASMICAIRYLRAGRTSFSDAFFPVALLNIGDAENLFWSWQLTFVIPAAMLCVIILIRLIDPLHEKPSTAICSGICTMLLPLCGAFGVFFAPLLAFWLVYCFVFQWHKVPTDQQKWIRIFCIASAEVTLGIVALYFIGYERQYWSPPSPGLGATLLTSAKFLALGFGPAVSRRWNLSILMAISLFLFTAYISMRALFRSQNFERHRARWVFLLLGNLGLFALVMGWGRAGLIARTSFFPTHYVVYSVPILCFCFFVSELYGSQTSRKFLQYGLLVVALFLMPFNTKAGFQWLDWYLQGMNAVQRDMLEGASSQTLAERHRDFLVPWWTETELAHSMLELHDHGIGPFKQLKKEGSKKSDGTILH